MPRSRPYGVSTHLYHGRQLAREHLLEVAAHGFREVELFATRSHFDYHQVASVATLQQWLAEAGLVLSSVHAPVTESFLGGRFGPPLSLASTDASARAQALILGLGFRTTDHFSPFTNFCTSSACVFGDTVV